MMWGRAPLRCSSRQAVDGASHRGSRCTCHAKRYVPANRQHRTASGGASRPGSAGRKPSAAPEPADPDDLLRELNSGGVGWLRDEEEQDWGLDEVAEHARARQQRQLQRFGGALPGAGAARGSSGSSGGGGRRRGGDAAVETHGSPLESGLASISTDEDGDEAIGASSSSSSRGRGGEDVRVFGADRLAARAPAARQSRTTVELEASYARRNPEIVEALRLRGVAVRVRQPAGDANEEYDDDFGGDALGRSSDEDPDLDEFGLSDEDDGLDLRLDSDLASAEDGGGAAPGSRSGSGSRDWYGSLAAAGFSVRTNAAGEVFLERTVRRKVADTGGGGAAAAAAAAAPTGAQSGGSSSATAARKEPARGAPSSAAPAAAAAAAAAPPLLVSPLKPLRGRPAIVSALQRLTTPQQVLDFLELSYTEWAANGYRLVDMRTGRPVAAPSPAEAAHCLRALAITARRSEIGGWQCLDLAAGRQAQGLAEALRVTPPRLLPEQATPQLSAAYFDAARRFWLDMATDPIIDDPRVGRARAGAKPSPTAGGEGGAGAGAPLRPGSAGSGGLGGAAAAAAAAAKEATATATAGVGEAADEEYGFSSRVVPSSDKVYDNLVAKYTAASQHERQLLSQLQAKGEEQSSPQQQQQPPSGKRLLKGQAAPPTTAAATTAAVPTAARAGETVREELTGAVPPSSAAAATASEAVVRRAAKIESLVSALWAMSSLGGPPYFKDETEAAVTILVRCLAAAATGAAAAAAAGSASAPPAGSLTGWQAGQVLWALGNSRHVTPRLADLETHILRSGGLAAMQSRDVSRVLWGFASLGHRPERLLLTIRPDWAWRERTAAAVSERAEGGGRRRRGKARGKRAGSGGGGGGGDLRGDVRSFNPQQLAGAVWALAVMEQVDTGPFRSAWAQLLRCASEVPPAEPVLTQIWQANLAIQLESSSTSANTTVAAGAAASTDVQGRGGGAGKRGVAAEDLTAAGLAAAAAAAGSPGGACLDVSAARSLLLRARDVFLAATSGLRRRVQSGYQRQMANTLTGLRLMHLLEDNSAGYSVDITLPQLRIALEADGPTHTSRTPGGAVLGATAMKRRHLQRLGWHVLNVTYQEWDKLTSESARRAFLQERINDALLSNIKLEEEE
ncbi:hypothetical protein PLESTB_001061500 [Pleodorina starrii]|uniref:RAP domain-containing protein n=1 Tax=Pleodorina starrii TaxID=330485 RepID=A0A9W6BQ63_9CHLO|nr:hypothetical protein PLESTB_001061500 [Pleodorina starrii]GLC64055.1 hypothetical protein PLESTF_000113300 [Pleodorina starrii]